MKPALHLGGLAKPAAWEWIVRFVFGGCVTVATGLVGRYLRLALGGMCLAFPAILPASLTLVKRHDGRAQAIDDARGARLGAVGLAAFALTAIALRRGPAPVVLAAATAAWTATALILWFAIHGRRSDR